MSTGFEAVREQIDKDLAERSSQEQEPKEERTEPQSNVDTKEANQQTSERTRKAAEAVFDLDKAEKFRFDGKEMTRKEFNAYVMRQKDYTEKTQRLAEERRTFDSQREEEKKYDANLLIDIENVRRNPALAGEFIKVYPERYHGYLKQALGINSSQSSQTGQSNQPQIPVELMSEVQQLKTFVHAQEVAKAEADIESNLNRALSTYTFVDEKEKKAVRIEAIAEAFELHNRGVKITSEMWDNFIKESYEARLESHKAYYANLVNKQTQANSKSRDVGGGGGTPGMAPKQKFDPKKGFGALNKEVFGELTRERN